jgi:UDP-N-acetylmuramoyl-tripeptide--D-alanyl-D-alanine ligase
MVGNALLALAAACLAGITLEEAAHALSLTRLTGGRLTRIDHRGATLLDDTYNANPDSMVAALETVAAMDVPGRKIAVLGRMGELGDHAPAGYRRVGVAAAEGIDELICVGSEASAIAEAATGAGCASVRVVADNHTAARLLSERLSAGDLVLLKASRSARMEEILQQLD